MIDLIDIVEQHRHDFQDKQLFTAYSAAVPVYRLRAVLLVKESIEVDPIDAFLLRGISKGLNTPTQLTSFFGLDQYVVEDSLGNMLHHEWLLARPTPDKGIVLSLQPLGKEVLSQEQAIVEQTRDAEIWVDSLTGKCEIKKPRTRLLQLRDVKAQQLFSLGTVVPAPRRSSELDFNNLQQSLSAVGPQLWPGTRLAVLLDILSVSTRGTGYKPVQVLAFQVERASSFEFEVFDAGGRDEQYERILRRLDSERNVSLVPTEPIPPPDELAAYRAEVKQIERLAAAEAKTSAAQVSPVEPELAPSSDMVGVPALPLQEESPTPQPSPVIAGRTTTQRLRSELLDAHARIDSLEELINDQALVRNEENRIFWKRVLLGKAVSFVVMEFPWVSRGALNDEMLNCFAAALQRKVKLWITWGIDEEGPTKRSNDDWVLQKIEQLGRQFRNPVHIHYRGNTHRKVLFWDGAGALIGSFNFGSFGADPRKGIREELSALIRSPRELANLAEEYQKLFGVEILGR